MESASTPNDCSEHQEACKRVKHSDGKNDPPLCEADIPSTKTKHPLITSYKGRKHLNAKDSAPTEYVLHIPPRLTKTAYQTLIHTECVARPWHLEGRFGSRTHVVEKGITNGIPILFDQKSMEERALESAELQELLNTEGVKVVEKEFIRNHRTRLDMNMPAFDARVHPELEPEGYKFCPIVPKLIKKPSDRKEALFTYSELFGGIGGFGVALDALGGKCVFYSEIEERCRDTYVLNFDTPPECIHGDIYQVPDAAFPKELDVLVGGFPCQPFSKLGEQPGFGCDKGRGQLYMEIVRMLRVSRPKCFLLENVPGLEEMQETLDVILTALREAGYYVKAEVCSARGLVASKRKRLFFVGIRKTQTSSKADKSFFQFPYIPDLRLCAADVLDYETLPQPELDILRLSSSAWEQLNNNKRWRPHQLAWPNGHCEPLTSHYGNSVGRGESQLVPSCSPHLPRRFSVRETARIMGEKLKYL
jgi:site-specific DNA-cytosine methylase